MTYVFDVMIGIRIICNLLILLFFKTDDLRTFQSFECFTKIIIDVIHILPIRFY